MINFIDPEREEAHYWNPVPSILSAAAILLFVVFAVVFVFKGSTEGLALQPDQTAQANASGEDVLKTGEGDLASKEEQMADKEAAIKELAGIHTGIINELTDKLSSLKLPIEINNATGSIRFTESVLFGVGNDKLNDEGRQYLKAFMPVYLSVLLSSENEKYLDQIIIEGHADVDGDYRSNLFLSQDRANSVMNFILEQQLTEISNGMSAVKYLTVSARSYNAPVPVNGVPDRSQSRRVEFVFRLKDEALLQKMQDIYRGEE